MMQASALRCVLRRGLATTAAHPPHATSPHPHQQPSAASASASASASAIPLSNVEAQWSHLSSSEQTVVHQQLEELQRKDWKTLSLSEKKAAYYVAFGPHGPRASANPPGTTVKVLTGVSALVATAGLLYAGIRSIAPPPPKTITKEWEEATNERAKELKLNPITGITSEGYSGKGYVTHK
ncbi:cytochrome c oxidase subunit IV-domain-containing protein [Multifurca ochricompacta]|uniref:Cytochrome c oxidase subunit IV-domain-containing protein n=1 Tax=Multifurca ochricompacta TaxID=376703 RepID=A0AAD4LXF2_9AGAM|nr:cytochrome c oxidase subunit IV-domain-containing protein [Multifurca ochricompacta]